MNNVGKKIAKLSLLNLKSHKWLYSKMSLAFAVLVFLVCLFSTYAITLNSMQRQTVAEHSASNVFVSPQPMTGLPNDTESFSVWRYNAYPFEEEEEEVIECNDAEDKDDDFDFEIRPYVPLEITLQVDGNKYDPFSDGWQIVSFNNIFGGDKFVTVNDKAELHRRYGMDDCIVGRMPSSANEALVSEQLLSFFDLSADDVINKHLTLTLKRGDNFCEVGDLLVCGVVAKEFAELSGHGVSKGITPCLFLSKDNPIFADEERATITYVYSLSYWLSEEEVDEIIANNERSVFLGRSNLDDMVRLQQMQAIAVRLFLVAGGALGVSLVLMIMLMMDRLTAVFSRDCGILLSCGMEWKRAKQLLLTLIAWVCLFAVVVAVILTTVSVSLINWAIYDYYRMEISISIGTAIALFVIGIATVALVAFAYYLYAVGQLKGKTVKDFLNVQLN